MRKMGRTDEGAKRPVTRRSCILAVRAMYAVHVVRCFVTLNLICQPNGPTTVHQP